MRTKFFGVLMVLILVLMSTTIALADKPTEFDPNGIEIRWEKSGCTTIQSGLLQNSAGEVLTTGYDSWGYNYQAHMFNGGYCDAYRDAAWCQPYKEDELIMKWNDAWLANTDCGVDGQVGDGKLDRHNGFVSYVGSEAWLTNHQKGVYELNGETCHWEYFTKIIAAPADAVKIAGVWYAGDGTEIGPDIWGEFAIIEEIINDPCDGSNGVSYLSPDHPGFGGW